MKVPVTRKNISRERIETVAVALFNRKGVEGTSVNDIVARAGIAKGTFYLYFRDKDDLINAVFERYLGDFTATVIDAYRETMKILLVAPAVLGFFADHPLFLTELRRALMAGKRYRYTEKAVAALTGLILGFLNRDARYPITQVDVYALTIIGAILDICYRLIIEKSISRSSEAQAMLEDLMKRFFNCE